MGWVRRSTLAERASEDGSSGALHVSVCALRCVSPTAPTARTDNVLDYIYVTTHQPYCDRARAKLLCLLDGRNKKKHFFLFSFGLLRTSS